MAACYDRLIDELHAASRGPAQRERPLDPEVFAASDQQTFDKSMSDITDRLTGLAAQTRLATQAKPTVTLRDRRQRVGEVITKALDAYRAGRINGEQLRLIEARHHRAVDILAQRGDL